jgi:tRNA (guanine6-N2)-methyltransferase
MAKHRAAAVTPPCYALVHPGLEEVAADEIARDLGGEVKRTASGLVVFRVPQIEPALLDLRTTEDIFLLAWGSDQLTHRAEDLDKIRRWTARDVNWQNLLQIHHNIRPKPKGRPTYRLITQMEGQHGYLRRDARKALAEGLLGKFPDSWRPAEENASIEVWLTIEGAQAVCGLRLSDRTMRHRTYKLEHRPASLRPTMAAAMVRLAEIKPRHVVVDPMCGVGTILAEHLAVKGKIRAPIALALGGDNERGAVRSAASNLGRLGRVQLLHWDATRLPLADAAVDRIVSNPPFGKQLETPEAIGPLYQRMVQEYDRVLRPGGRVILLASDQRSVREAARLAGWGKQRELRVRVLGQMAFISVWRKAER